jgi:hypothetical protein
MSGICSEAKLLDAKKLVWSQVNPKLHHAELLLRESQTSCGEERTFGLLVFFNSNLVFL